MKKKIFFILLFFLVTVGYFFYKNYFLTSRNNVVREGYILIPKKASFSQILDSISPYLKDPKSFEKVAKKNHLNKYFHAGRYFIKNGSGNESIVQMIKQGIQTENTFRIGDFSDVYTMIGRITKKTEADSATFVKSWNKISVKRGFHDVEDLKPYFFIDTYNFFWTVTPEEFFSRFEKLYTEFWNQERREKEKKLNLTRSQIYALASIVYRESGGRPDEQRTIAGLYLNRYKKGMKLQSDPTVIYAVKKNVNFKRKIRRVLHKDLKIPSPYNTYLNTGIPPGPICVVDRNSVDAVLNAETHDYLYMCADPSRIGYHKFTKSDKEHMKNAKAYQEWLNSLNLKK
ncbi:MAG: endolytic transglycosylase MltG [Bergeyella sp.]|nr:endolytic transglycosylase MltG [Bergeyella sp.]